MSPSDDSKNPYQSPGQSPNQVPLSDYYVLNSAKLAYRELWSLSSNWIQFLALCLFKLFGHRVASIVATRIPNSLIDLEVENVRKELREALNRQYAKLEGTGLEHLCYIQSPVVGQTEQVAKVGFSRADNSLVIVQHLRVYAGGQRHTIERFIFQSPLGGGRYLWTISGRPSLWHSPDCDVEYFSVRGVSLAWQRHLDRLSKVGDAPRINDGEVAKTMMVEWWKNEYTHQVERGVYERVDVDRLQEIRKLQEQFEEQWPEYRQPDRLVSRLNVLFICLFVVGALQTIISGIDAFGGAAFYLQWIAVFGIFGTFILRWFRQRLDVNRQNKRKE